jgi:hypothetical protein
VAGNLGSCYFDSLLDTVKFDLIFVVFSQYRVISQYGGEEFHERNVGMDRYSLTKNVFVFTFFTVQKESLAVSFSSHLLSEGVHKVPNSYCTTPLQPVVEFHFLVISTLTFCIPSYNIQDVILCGTELQLQQTTAKWSNCELRRPFKYRNTLSHFSSLLYHLPLHFPSFISFILILSTINVSNML